MNHTYASNRILRHLRITGITVILIISALGAAIGQNPERGGEAGGERSVARQEFVA